MLFWYSTLFELVHLYLILHETAILDFQLIQRDHENPFAIELPYETQFGRSCIRPLWKRSDCSFVEDCVR